MGPTEEASRADFDKLITNAINSAKVDDMPAWQSAELATHVEKMKRMMLHAFDIGRRDARSTCSASENQS